MAIALALFLGTNFFFIVIFVVVVNVLVAMHLVRNLCDIYDAEDGAALLVVGY